MKRSVVLGVIIILIVLAIVFFFYKNNHTNSSFENLQTGEDSPRDTNEELAENRVASIFSNVDDRMQNISDEQEISSFSTAIKDKEAGRLTNISITCNTLNNTIIRKGETFSFNEVVGEPTPERGYQEASVIIDQKTQRGIGGRKLPS